MLSEYELMLYEAVLRRTAKHKALCFEDAVTEFRSMYPGIKISNHKLNKYWAKLIKLGLLVYKPVYEVFPELRHIHLPKRSYYVIGDAKSIVQKGIQGCGFVDG